MKKIWLFDIGEPLCIDGKDVRLRRLGNFAEYLSNIENVEIHYFSISFEHYNKYQRVDSDTTFDIKDNYKMHIVYVPGYKKNISIQRIQCHRISAIKILKWMKMLETPDVIFCGNTPLELVDGVQEYASEKNIPMIVDIRDLWPDVYRDSLPSGLRLAIEPYISMCKHKMKKAYEKIDAFVGLSPAFLQYALDIAGREKRYEDRIIPIGYPDYNYDILPERFDELWGSYGLKHDDFIIAFTGNFGRQFTFNSIVDAANRLQNSSHIKFVLCGTGIQESEIKKKTGKNVIFPGWVGKDMITSLLCFSNMGLAPYIDSYNYRMNTPNKFGEYLSAGLPVLLEVDGIMRETVETNQCGYYYKNGNELKNIIEKVSSDLLLQNRLQINSRELYQNSYSLNIANKRLSNIVFEIADRSVEQNVTVRKIGQ